MSTIARKKIATAYVEFDSNFGDIIKQTKQLSDAMKAAHDTMQEEVDESISRFQKLQKVLGSMSKTVRISFSISASVVNIFIGVIKILSATVKFAYNIFKGFIKIIGKGLVMAVNLAIRAVMKLIKTIVKLGIAVMSGLKKLLTLPRTIGKKLDDLTKKFVFLQLDIRYIIDQFRAIFLATTAITGAASYFLAQYEDAFVRVRKVVDMTKTSFVELSSNIENLSTRVVTSTKNLTKLAAVGGQLGIEGVANLTRFTDVMSKLQMTTNIAGEEGASQFSRLLNIMGISQEQMKNMASTMVDLGNNFAAFENEILSMSFKLAGAGKAIGLTTQEVFGLSTALSAAGVRAERGGSAVSRVMLEMANAAFSGGERLEEFAKIAGLTTDEMQKMIKNMPIKAIEGFIQGLRRIDQEGENVFDALEKVNVSQIRTRDVLLRLVAAEGLTEDAVKTANEAWKENTALTEEVAKRNQTIIAQLTMLKNQATKFARAIGRLYEDQLKEFVGMLRLAAEVLNNLSQEQLETIKDILTLVAVVSGVVTALTMMVKGFFTFMTGLTLVARFIVWLAPLLLFFKLFSGILDSLDVTPIEFLQGAFKTLGSIIEGVWNTTEGFVQWLSETEFAKNVHEIFVDLIEELQKISDNEKIPLKLKFAMSAESVTEAAVDIMNEVNDALNRVISSSGEMFKTKDPFANINMNQFQEKNFMKTGVLSSDLAKPLVSASLKRTAKNIAEIFKIALRIGFITLPTLLWNVFKNSPKVEDAANAMKETFKDAWNDFTDYTQETLPDITMWMNSMSNALDNTDVKTIDWSKLSEGNSLINFWDLVTLGEGGEDGWSGLFANKADRDAFVEGIQELLKSVGGVVADFFGTQIESVLTEIDWYSIFNSMMVGLWGAFIDSLGIQIGGGSNRNIRYDELFPENLVSDQSSTLDLNDSNQNLLSEIRDFFDQWEMPGGKQDYDIRNLGNNKLSSGTILSGYGGGDQIPALLERGEAVVPKEAVQGGMRGVAKWFKSMGAPGFKEGTTDLSFIRSISSFSGLNENFLGGFQESLSEIVDEIFDYLDKYLKIAVKQLVKIVQLLGDFIKLFFDDPAKKQKIDDLVTEAVGWLQKLLEEQEETTDTFRAAGRMVGGSDTPRAAGRPVRGVSRVPLTPWQNLMKDMSKIWDSTKDGFDSFIALMGSAQEKMSQVFLNIKEWFQLPLERKLYDIRNAFATALYTIRDALVTGGEVIGNMLLQGAPKLGNFLKVVGEGSGWEQEQIDKEPFAAFIEAFKVNPINAFISMIMQLMKESKQFQELVSIINEMLSVLAEIFGALLEPLIPIVKALAEALLPIFKVLARILAVLLKPLKILVPIIEFLGEVILGVAKAIAKIWNLIIGIIDLIPFVNMSGWYISLDGLEEGLDDTADAAEDAAEALNNVPDGFKYALRSFQSANPTASYLNVQSAQTGGYVQSGGLVNVHAAEIIQSPEQETSPPQIIIQGDVYGWDDFRSKVAQAQGETNRELNMSDIGVGTV